MLHRQLTVFIPYVSENEITEVIQSLKNSSALTHLINSSFENGLFPDELKIAKVIPIFKTGVKKRYNKL